MNTVSRKYKKRCQWLALPIWRLRFQMHMPGELSREENTPNIYYHYDLLDNSGKHLGTLLADARLNTREEALLVKKIAQATKTQIMGGLKKGVLTLDTKYNPVIMLLGSQVAGYFSMYSQSIAQRSAFVMSSYSPAELLEDNARKLTTWRDIQKAMAQMEKCRSF